MRLFLLSFLILLSVPAVAQERYFEALYDIPVMPGMEEVPGEAVLFDAAEGRIASTLAGIRGQEGPVSAFYDRSLAAMGWQKTGQNQYVRDGALLSLDFSPKPPVLYVRFTLSPAPRG